MLLGPGYFPYDIDPSATTWHLEGDGAHEERKLVISLDKVRNVHVVHVHVQVYVACASHAYVHALHVP